MAEENNGVVVDNSEAPESDLNKAVKFVRDSSNTQIIDELVRLRSALNEVTESRNSYRKRYLDLHTLHNNDIERITEWVRRNFVEGGASASNLKSLAEEMEIELVKKVTVTFKVDVAYTYEVSLDFKTDDIDENDFGVQININGDLLNENLDEQEINIEDFDVVTDND